MGMGAGMGAIGTIGIIGTTGIGLDSRLISFNKFGLGSKLIPLSNFGPSSNFVSGNRRSSPCFGTCWYIVREPVSSMTSFLENRRAPPTVLRLVINPAFSHRNSVRLDMPSVRAASEIVNTPETEVCARDVRMEDLAWGIPMRICSEMRWTPKESIVVGNLPAAIHR